MSSSKYRNAFQRIRASGALLGQNRGYRLVVGPDDCARGLPLVELIQRNRKRHDDGPADGFIGLNLRLRRERRLRAILQGRERLKISFEVHRGDRLSGCLSARSLDGALQSVYIEDLVAGVAER